MEIFQELDLPQNIFYNLLQISQEVPQKVASYMTLLQFPTQCLIENYRKE